MIYLASFDSNGDFELLDFIWDEFSLIAINKYIRRSKYTIDLPILNNSFALREHGIAVIYYFNENKIYYAMDSNHKDYKDKVRNKLIDNFLLENNM